MAELEKEVGRLRANERSLRDAVCNKLLLEEQVHQLQSRVDALQPVQDELHEAKVRYRFAVLLLQKLCVCVLYIKVLFISKCPFEKSVLLRAKDVVPGRPRA